MKKLFVVLFATMMVAPAFGQVVATVNGHPITKKQFEDYHLQNLKNIGSRKVTKELSLQDLINRELGIERAKKTGMDKDPDVIEKQNDILYHAQISKDLEGELQKITVSDDEVKKYYETNKEYRTAHILTRVRVDPTPEEVKSAYTASVEIYSAIQKSPEDFAKLANKFSQSSASAMGGDLGFQPPTRLAPEYYEAIKGQKVGFVTKPVRTQMGFHVIKILGAKSYDQIDKNLYKKIIYDIKRDAILDNYFKNMAKGADIKTGPTPL